VQTTKPKPVASVVAPPSVASAVARALENAPEPSKAEPPKALPKHERDDRPVANSRFVLDELHDLAPAGPSAAFAGGVVMVTRADELVISKLNRPPSKLKKPGPGALDAITRGASEFWPVARGPAVCATHAYWVSKGRLVRRALVGGGLEVLATDAREGTRVATAGSPDLVAYLAQPPAPAASEPKPRGEPGQPDPVAKLRLPDGRVLDLTPQGAAASSVSLTSMGDDVMAATIDGRSAMTPVHARRYRTQKGVLEPDVVVWVSGATQGLTEISSVGTEAGAWLLMAVERDVSHFGLAAMLVEPDPKMDPPLRWRTYENGLDRAPAAAAVVCGAPFVIYVRPADSNPGSNQELVLSELTLAEAASSEVLATARGFADVSLYSLPEGAVVAYVADRRTWARVVRCK
jgi:hypothetical protein